MTVWGIGPKLIGLTALYALPAVLAEFLWPSRFALHGVPSAAFLIAGGILIAIGIPIWILASNDVDRAYDEGILATQGMYALCRHPIYGTAVCLVLPGVVLLFRSVWLLTIPVAAYLFCRLLLSNEEDHLRRTFGPAYRAYEKTVPALFPALWKIPNAFFYPIPTGKLDENVYAVRDGDVDMFLYTDGRNTIAVDCGYSAKRIARELTNLSIDPAAITHLFLTHTDMDHTGGLELLPHAEVHLSAVEEQMIGGRTARLLGIFRNQPISRPHTALADGDIVTAGEIRVRAVATPGHTPGSMSFLVNDKVLFTGDALILRNGRVEAFYPLLCMNMETVKTSIRRLTALEGIVRLCTAHTGCSGAFREAMKRWRPAGELRETGKKKTPLSHPTFRTRRSGEETMKKKAWFWLSNIVWPIFIAQYILAFFVYGLPGWPPLQAVGWVIWVISVIFGIAPIIILGRRGAIPKGKSYVSTTQLVDTSLYAIVRHPQYLAGILLNIALMLLAQHVVVILLGLASAVLLYIDIQDADREGIEKFGETYRAYMQRVPQVNFLLGLWRLIRRRPSSTQRKP